MPPVLTQPQLTPVVRHRLKETFPKLRDEDLPTVAVTEAELIERIAHRTGRRPPAIRRILLEIGALVPANHAKGELHADTGVEESLGSGVPDDTSQSGIMGMGPGW